MTGKVIATFNLVHEKVVNEMQRVEKYPEDIAESLRKLQEFDTIKLKPTVKIITKTEASLKDGSNDQNVKAAQGEYQEDTKQWKARERQYSANKINAYSTIWSKYCTMTMQMKLKQEVDYEKFRNDPIKLLLKIRKLVQTPEKAVYPMASLFEAIRRLLNIRQGEEELLVVYLERFKSERDIIRDQIGENFLDSFIENTSEYKEAKDAAEQKKMKEDGFESFMTTIFMMNAYKPIYESLVERLRTDWTMEMDNYPRRLSRAIELMKHEETKYRLKKKNEKTNKKKNEDQSGESERNETSFAQRNRQQNSTSERRCYCCGSRDHMLNECRLRTQIAEVRWFKNTGEEISSDEISSYQDSTQSNDEQSAASNRANNSSQGTSFTMYHYNTKQENMKLSIEELDNVFMLDSGTTKSLCGNENLVTSIQMAKKPIEVKTSAGTTVIDMMSKVPGFGETMYKKGVPNILSLKEMTKVGKVTYNSEVDDAFYVKLYGDKRLIRFGNDIEGLYTYRPSKNYLNQIKKLKNNMKEVALQMISNKLDSVKINEEGFSERQVKRARGAVSTMHAGGAPTTEQFKWLIKNNKVRGMPVIEEDIKVADEIWKADISSLKGKSVREKPNVVTTEFETVPNVLLAKCRIVELCVDIMFVNQCVFLTTIDKTVKYRCTIPMSNRRADEISSGLKKIFNHYNKGGLLVSVVHADHEFAAPMEEAVDEFPGVHLNITNPDEHVPQAERNNRTIQERVRVGYHRMPYKAIPKIMMKALVLRNTFNLNLYLPKDGVSRIYSPHQIVSQKPISYSHHLKFETGDYVQAITENNPKNTNMSRRIDGIYLRPTMILQEGHILMDLQTGREFARARVVKTPITDHVIKRVEQIATGQGFKSLKFF